MDIPKLSKVLEEFKQIPKSFSRHQTFLEISGYPHRETVYSNIFRFFFDSEECHGLGNLFLCSLLNVLDIDGSNEWSCGVETEKGTNDGKRIDIIVETDSYLIGIENKVFHNVNNPFASYKAYLDNRSKNCEKLGVLKVILCLNDNGVRGESKENLYGFRPITYEQFFNEIKKNIGDCLIQAQPKYLTMLSDFMETIENIGKGSSMNKVFLDFIKEQKEPIEELICELDKFRKELRQKVQSLGSEIKIGENVKLWYWKENRNSLFDTLVHDITLSESSIIAKIYTEEFGIQSYMVRGVRKKGSKMSRCVFGLM